MPAIPQPAPLFEIYVYSPAMEGIHLRGGKVARGGLRWSDRQDYRTEVYGLMRAQVTKNAVIVPAGAKGGFYLKDPPAGREELKAEVERQYVRFVGGLLELTDNLVEGEVVHPEHVRVLDEDDTYLVVAADKGTATFSDTANAVSERARLLARRRVRLRRVDGLRPQGARDHRARRVGVGQAPLLRARPRRRRRSPSPWSASATCPATCSATGCCCSEQIRLVAAYDHRHVFIDPDPDAAAGFAERKRLFELPGLLVGRLRPREDLRGRRRVAARGEVDHALAPRRARRWGSRTSGSRPTTSSARSCARPVDLLWNGGIGTVVKASEETDADAKDRASDAIRVDASDLRCRVIGEGGNLGLTRRARVEFAADGGLVNADFIDNSGGVDCSDHEVNLKILLGLAERARGARPAGPRRPAARRHRGRRRARALRLVPAGADPLPGGRDRALADVRLRGPDGGARGRAGCSTAPPRRCRRPRRWRSGAAPAAGSSGRSSRSCSPTRSARSPATCSPSDFCEDPWLERDLREYFPDPVVERFGHLLAEHPLRRELIAMVNANQVVNSLGPTFVSQLAAERGAEVADVVRAFRIAREVVGADARWDKVEGLGRDVPRDVATQLMTGVDRLVEAAARWYLAHPGPGGLEDRIAAAEAAFAQLVAVLPEIGEVDWREHRARVAERLEDAGAPREVAWAHALTPELMQAPDVIGVAERTGRPVEDVTRAFHRLAAELDIVWLLGALDDLPQPTRTQRWAVQAVREDCLDALAELACCALEQVPEAPAPEAVDAYLAERAALTRRLHAVTASLTIEGTGDLPGADAGRAGVAGAGRLMAELILGPLLRYVGEDEATVWVETDAPCEVEVLGCVQRTFRVADHHFALVHVTGLEPGTTTPYEVRLDGERVWPLDGVGLAGRARSARWARAAQRRARVGLLPRDGARPSAALPAQGQAPGRPRGRRAAAAGRADARGRGGGVAATGWSCSATRSTPTRSRRRSPTSSAPAATRRCRRARPSPTSRSTPSSTGPRGRTRRSAGCSPRCPRPWSSTTTTSTTTGTRRATGSRRCARPAGGTTGSSAGS